MKYNLIMFPDHPILVSDEKVQVELNKWYYEPDNNIQIYKFTEETLPKNYFLHQIVAGYCELPHMDFSSLTEEECKRIGWIDVEGLFMDKITSQYPKKHIHNAKLWFKEGFQKSQKLNQKKFTEEDMKNAFLKGMYHFSTCMKKLPVDPKTVINSADEFLLFIQQSETFEVEIETETLWLNERFGGTWQPFPDSKAAEKRYEPKIINNSIKILKVL